MSEILMVLSFSKHSSVTCQDFTANVTIFKSRLLKLRRARALLDSLKKFSTPHISKKNKLPAYLSQKKPFKTQD